MAAAPSDCFRLDRQRLVCDRLAREDYGSRVDRALQLLHVRTAPHLLAQPIMLVHDQPQRRCRLDVEPGRAGRDGIADRVHMGDRTGDARVFLGPAQMDNPIFSQRKPATRCAHVEDRLVEIRIVRFDRTAGHRGAPATSAQRALCGDFEP